MKQEETRRNSTHEIQSKESDFGRDASSKVVTKPIKTTRRDKVDFTSLSYPKEENVDYLLEEHHERISEISEYVKSLDLELNKRVDPTLVDDVFFLRHILSSRGNIEKAKESIEKCLEWRIQNEALLSNCEEHAEGEDNLVPVLFYPQLTNSGHLLNIRIFPNKERLKAYLNLPYQWHFESGCGNREVLFRKVDARTRKTRRICKVINVMDIKAMPVSMFYSQAMHLKTQSKLSHISTFAYPQLLHRVVVINAPRFSIALFSFFSRFFSKRTVEKIRLLSTKYTTETICEAADLDKKSIPTIWGGVRKWGEEYRGVGNTSDTTGAETSAGEKGDSASQTGDDNDGD